MKINYIPKDLLPKVHFEDNFATNVNPLGPPKWALEFLSSNISLCTLYPELWHQNVDKEVGNKLGLDSDNHLTISGTSQFLFSLPSLLEDNRNEQNNSKWAITAPSFWNTH